MKITYTGKNVVAEAENALDTWVLLNNDSLKKMYHPEGQKQENSYSGRKFIYCSFPNCNGRMNPGKREKLGKGFVSLVD